MTFWLVGLFTLTSFLSAFLLFSIQPMFAKMVLPLLGGSPAVWNTCMVFFQTALLAGYAVVHFAVVRFRMRRQILLHVALLLWPLFLIPISLPQGWTPPTEANPIPWLIILMLHTVGLPFVVVAMSAPVLQRWFAHTEHPAASDPYFLYAASNCGSLIALLSYPVLVEPHLRLAQQSRVWTIGYGLLVLLLLGCAWITSRSSRMVTTERASADRSVAPTIKRRLRWIVLSFVPSSLMLGVTTYLSTDIAAIPLFWVIPLAVYLTTFIVVFARHRVIAHGAMVSMLPFIVLPLTVLMTYEQTRPAWLPFPIHLLLLFVAAMICHGELAQGRPSPQYLTAFYLYLSIGGALGG